MFLDLTSGEECQNAPLVLIKQGLPLSNPYCLHEPARMAPYLLVM